MTLEQLHTDFWKNGYLVLEGFFDSDLMDRMDQTIRDWFGDDPKFWHEEEFLKKSKTEVIPWFPQNPELSEYDSERSAPFDQLEEDARLADLTQTLLGIDWKQLYCMVMFSRKGSAGQVGTPADITDICIYRNMRYSFASNSVVEERQPG